jgi:predicted DNA-binding ribbon-helix-helix protein
MYTQSEETPGVAMHRGLAYRGRSACTAGRLNHSALLCGFCNALGFSCGSQRRRLIFRVCCKSTAMGGCSMKSPVVKRSIVLAGHKTSVSLEDEFWRGLKEIAGKRLMSLSTLVDTIDEERQHGNLSSALRLFVLNHYRGRVCDMEARYGIHEALSHPASMHS